MQESLFVLGGVIVGTVFTCCGCALGAYLVKKTYMEITNPHPQELLLKLDKDIESDTDNPQGYDWDEYDDYLKPPHDDKGGEPEA